MWSNMLYLVIAIVLFIIIVSALWCMKISIHVHYMQANLHAEGVIRLSFLKGWMSKTWRVPNVEWDDEELSVKFKKNEDHWFKPSEQSQIEEETPRDLLHQWEASRAFLRKVKGFYVIVQKFMATVNVHEIQWKTQLGTGDAATTGTMTGMIWTVKTTVISFFSNRMKLKQMPKMSVLPFYQAAVFHTEFTCILRFQVGHAVLMVLRVLKHRKKSTHTVYSNVQSVKRGA